MAERKNGTYKGNTNGIIRQLPNGYQDLTQGDKIKLGLQSAKEHGRSIGRPEIWTEAVAMEFMNNLTEYLTEDDNRIYIGEFLAQYGLHHQIISELEHKFEKFSDGMKIIRMITESRILDQSSNGKRNPHFGKFVLQTKYDYKLDNINSDNSTPIQINFSFVQPSQIQPSNNPAIDLNSIPSNPQPIIDITPDPNKIDNTDKDNE